MHSGYRDVLSGLPITHVFLSSPAFANLSILQNGLATEKRAFTLREKILKEKIIASRRMSQGKSKEVGDM